MRHLNDETKLKNDKGKKNKGKNQTNSQSSATSQMKIYENLRCQLIALKKFLNPSKTETRLVIYPTY